jgi:hypothetical protein
MDARTRSWLLGLGSGVVATMAFPIVVPIARELARPVAKALLRGGLLGLDAARTQLARISEGVEDLIAEVGAEVKGELDRRGKADTEPVVVMNPGEEVEVAASAQAARQTKAVS